MKQLFADNSAVACMTWESRKTLLNQGRQTKLGNREIGIGTGCGRT